MGETEQLEAKRSLAAGSPPHLLLRATVVRRAPNWAKKILLICQLVKREGQFGSPDLPHWHWLRQIKMLLAMRSALLKNDLDLEAF
jgi:hypothetical protein